MHAKLQGPSINGCRAKGSSRGVYPLLGCMSRVTPRVPLTSASSGITAPLVIIGHPSSTGTPSWRSVAPGMGERKGPPAPIPLDPCMRRRAPTVPAIRTSCARGIPVGIPGDWHATSMPSWRGVAVIGEERGEDLAVGPHIGTRGPRMVSSCPASCCIRSIGMHGV